MYRTLMIRAGWLSLCLLTFATVSFSQPAPSETPAPNPRPAPLRIIYTGKSFGYFRSPDLQLSDITTGCRADSGPSKAAVQFLSGPQDAKHPKKQIEQQTKFDSALRVSTGDNFAPQLEAREFSDSGVTAYMPGNKELYSWYKGQWIRLDDPKLPKATRDAAMAEAAKGTSTIPTDNVGCFLSAAHYDAIVPGKHDFYFGPERVRMLARFMAGIGDPLIVAETSDPGFRPVQMLGANLVIKTVSTEPATAATNQPKLPGEYSVVGLREGKSIYPWFSDSVQVNVPVLGDVLQEALKTWFSGQKKPHVGLEAFLKQQSKDDKQENKVKEAWNKLDKSINNLGSLQVCPAGAFNEITCAQNGWSPEVEVTLSENTITYTMKIGQEPATLNEKNPHYSTIEGGKKYGLCMQVPKEEKSTETDCFQFSVYAPFFYSPGSGPHSGTDYRDPFPFVLKEKPEERDREVAIFGVVDPAISEQVGVLNFSWLTDDRKSKSVVSAEEPAEALKELLGYFNVWYQKLTRKSFSGLKVLLAQMSPQRARLLAARLKGLKIEGFQIVVTAADEEQGTSETTLTTEFSRETQAGTFVAVPLPYFDTRQERTTEGTVHFGLIDVSTTEGGWKIAGSPLNKADIKKVENPATTFRGLVSRGLNQCLPTEFRKGDPPAGDVRLLTMCVMRERLGADVAMIQKRDFFDNLPQEAGDGSEKAQRILDRMIWKGDLLTLLYLPGSTIKKMLDQAKKYDDDDANSLSLSDEKQRGLLYLGIRKSDNEYLINEAFIDDKKIYTVATTDYIGAGDTGYSDLATAINPKTRAAQFPDKLVPISGLVCRKLFAGSVNAPCLSDFTTEKYLDSTIAEAPPAPRPRGFGSRLHDLFPFKTPKDPVAPTTLIDKVQQRAQHRPIWILSLKNLSLQFNSLDNNLSDADIDQKYGGITTPGITTHSNHSINFGLGARLSRSSHRRELFAEIGMDYKEQSTGVSNTTPQVAQLTNRVTADLGLIRNFRGGRSSITWGGKLSLHAETTLRQPFTTFTLGTQTVVDPANNIKVQDRLRISQQRAVLLLPRAGLRLQNRAHSLEFGFEGGKEIDALSGYRFTTQGTVDTCLASAAKSLASCIKSKSTPPNATITKDSAASAILEDRWRAGAYWKFTFSIPFSPKVKYDLTQEADFFFVNFHRDNPTDIRYRDLSKNSLKFMVWPNFSIGPTLQLLFYQNKVNRDFLFQKQFGIEANFAFDVFNRREKGVQLKHKP